jgi:hypothetical protein
MGFGDVGSVWRSCLVSGFALTGCTITVAGGVATVNTGGAQHGQMQHGVALIEGCAAAAMNAEHRVLAVLGPNEYTLAASGAGMSQRVAPAGWAEPFGPNTNVFRSAELQGPRHFVHLGATEYRSDAEYPYNGQIVRAYTHIDALADIDANLANPYNGVNLSVPTSLGTGWWMVATPSAFYFSAGADANGAPGPFMFFGEFESLSGDRPGWASAISQTIAGFSLVSWTQVGGPLHFSNSDLVIAGSPLIGGLGGALAKLSSERTRQQGQVMSGADPSWAWPQTVGGALVLSRPLVTIGDWQPQQIGNLPGLYHIPQTITGVNWTSPVLIDGSGPLAGRKLMAAQINWGTSKPSLVFDITGPW